MSAPCKGGTSSTFENVTVTMRATDAGARLGFLFMRLSPGCSQTGRSNTERVRPERPEGADRRRAASVVQVAETVEDRLRPGGLPGAGGRQHEDHGAADDGPVVCAVSRLLSVRTKLCCRGMVRDLHRSAGRCFKGCECCKSRLHPVDINVGHFF